MIAVGIDVSKSKSTVAILNADGSGACKTQDLHYCHPSRQTGRPSPGSAGLVRPGPAPGEEGDMVLTASSRLTVRFPDATVTGTRDQFRNGRADPGGGPERLPSLPPPPPPPPP